MNRLIFIPEKYGFDPQALLYLAAIVVILLCGTAILARERPGRTLGLVLMHVVVLFFWLVARGCARSAIDPIFALFWYRVSYIYVPIGIAAMLHYIYLTVGMERERMVWIRATWGFALLCAAEPLVLGRFSVTGVQSFRWGYEPVHGLLGTVMFLAVIVVICRVSLDFIRLLRVVPKHTDRSRRISTTAVATCFLYLAATDFLVAEGVPVYPLSFIAIPGFFIGITWVTVRFGLADINADIAADRILNVIKTPILVLDMSGWIRVANDAAATLLDRPVSNLVSNTVHGLFPKMPSMKHFSTDKSLKVVQEITLTGFVQGMEREFAVGVSVELNRRGEPQAYVCLLRDLTQERIEEQERLDASLQDPLTGLPGRSLFIQYVQRALDNRGEEARVVGLLKVSIDRFSKINEELTYASGDFLLRYMAGRLEELCGPQDVVGRIDGDEFGVLLGAVESTEELDRTGRQIVEKAAEPVTVQGKTVYLSVSVGGAASQGENPDAQGLMRNALLAMQAAKSAGGQRLRLYDTDTDGEGVGEVTLEAEIRRGLENDEFVPYYQPIVELNSERIIGYEMLARWEHPEHGLRAPAEFMDFAESTGLIAGISQQLQARAFRDLAALKKQLGTDEQAPYLSINVSAAEFESPDYVKDLNARVFAAALEPSDIFLELTERMVMISPDDRRLMFLESAGFRLLIDDFGTGYSSMTRLHHLPIYGLKIDRQFVVEMSHGERAESLVIGMIRLASSLGLRVVAEGIEQKQEAIKLKGFGCDAVQGYFFGRPAPAMLLPRPPANELTDQNVA